MLSNDSGLTADVIHQVNGRDFFDAIRVKQWIKNLVVPVVGFSMLEAEAELQSSILSIVCAFCAFCLAASSIYVFNDMMDIRKDRAHPVKRFRPIASGRIGASFLCALLAVSCPSAIFLAYIASPQIMFLLLMYFIINIAYCTRLKHVAQVDIVCVGSGFTLRALTGAYAVGTQVDFWILAAVTFSCMGLAVMKRMKELQALGGSGETRPVLAQYHYETLVRAHDIFMVLALQSLLMFLHRSSQKFSNQFTIAVFMTAMSGALLVFMHRVHSEQDGDPTALIYRNKSMAALMLLSLVALFLFK
ncbi:MAG: UbiA prenyltransferase family protein [Pseudomonadota bacterium]